MNPPDPNPERRLYFWAILPPEDISADIDALRQECSRRFDTHRARRLPVHLTVYPPFRIGKEDFLLMKEMISGWLAKQNSFEIELHDFGFFDRENPVAYVNVSVNPALLAFQKAFQKMMESFLGASQVQRDFNPHLTLAYQDLDRKHLPALKEFLSGLSVQVSFEFMELALFGHDGKVWEADGRYALGG